MPDRSSIMLLYVPVLHSGYVDFFSRHRDEARELLIPNADLVAALTPLEPEIRAIGPRMMARILNASRLVIECWCVGIADLERLTGRRLITANEEMSRRLVEMVPAPGEVVFDDIFLRWDEVSVMTQQPAGYDKVSNDDRHQRLMHEAKAEAAKSGDWWRRVGAVLVRDGKVILRAHNHHVPSDHTPYAVGDPRDFTPAGVSSEISTALHAEQAIITEAARQGIPLLGTSLVLTDFPCPMCAKQIAYSGIQTIFFGRGHASLDGQTVLRQNGVELVLVKNE